MAAKGNFCIHVVLAASPMDFHHGRSHREFKNMLVIPRNSLLGCSSAPEYLLGSTDVVLWPDRSIIKQSYDARERIMDASLPSHLAHGNLNGDGFGIGWHNACNEPSDPIPCVFTSVTPAW